ncbi:MAG: SAM-dependent methyltransferase [Lachnospiraceae bacterium]|nr:SAM-dependent methyltransferase [Lachnospiraceae bacterium]
METKKVQLSKRLQMLADMVTPGTVVADVGCDHGFLSIYLVQQGICPKVIASDVRRGPLDAACEHIRMYGLEDYIETRLSDGLMAYWPGEAQTLVCAGMGGRLMQQILMQSEPVTREFEELILQPQSEIRQFRVFLREQQYRIVKEDIVCEDDKYYFAFRVVHADGEEADRTMPRRGSFDGRFDGREQTDEQLRRLYDKFGEQLLRERNPVLRAYLEKGLAAARQVQEQMLAHRGDALSSRLEEGLAEQENQAADLEAALALYTKE